MKEKLPKAMLDALARQTPSPDHPSAGVLTAFLEQSLAEAERKPVADHLASCSTCREIVFLASNAAEEATEPKLEAAEKPQRRWMPRLVWATSLAVVLLVAGYFVRERRATTPLATEIASTAAQPAPAQPAEQRSPEARMQSSTETAASPTTTTPPPKRATKTSVPAAVPVRPRPAESMNALATSSSVPPKSNTLTAASKIAAPTEPKEPMTVAIGGAVAGVAPATPPVSSFVASPQQSLEKAGRSDAYAFSASRALAGASGAVQMFWRVGPEGHLEHQTTDGWTRALADQTAVFRVVFARGDQVWAGGDGGALFHSGDGGQQWSQVPLTSTSGPETAAVTTIRFSTPQHGLIMTSSSSVYTTNDGGATWSKQ